MARFAPALAGKHDLPASARAGCGDRADTYAACCASQGWQGNRVWSTTFQHSRLRHFGLGPPSGPRSRREAPRARVRPPQSRDRRHVVYGLGRSPRTVPPGSVSECGEGPEPAPVAGAIRPGRPRHRATLYMVSAGRFRAVPPGLVSDCGAGSRTAPAAGATRPAAAPCHVVYGLGGLLRTVPAGREAGRGDGLGPPPPPGRDPARPAVAPCHVVYGLSRSLSGRACCTAIRAWAAPDRLGASITRSAR